MKNIFKIFAFVLMVLLGQNAIAQVVGPGLNSNLNTWDLYVFGDGSAVGDILENISLFINPTSGNSGFRALIATMAVTGLFVSVLQAMLNPAQGFVRVMMLIGTYLVVSLTTFSMRLNVNVIDSINTGTARVVTDVPFSVGIMPVVISKVGYYLTESLETFLQIPGDNSRAFSLTRGNSRGHFNLFGKLVADLDKLRINDPSLKKSYSQYIADCAIPGMALGKLSLAEMQSSKNLLATLEKAATPALLTRYFASSNTPTTGSVSSGGTVLSCQDAMTNLKTDLTEYGNNLKDASAAQLDNTGIRVDQEIAYNALFKSLITGNNAAGGTNGSTSTSTLMLQKAMVSSTSDAFRKAASQTGNNELLQAARLSEAELNQRSAWVLGAETFKNMMGYVYIVLQCFIFAMVPLILIALMIPGLGRSILVNYVQIMLWMALWLPGLAVVNYLINLFGRGEMSQAANNGGTPPGINIYNHMALSEAGNNLVVAAQFLGTMVPTITWGLVKGAMAFQEFISAGVGSSFASSAANGLASGSLSYGNLSANTGKMNDFNTATSVGTGQGPTTFNRGVGNANENYGGGGEKAGTYAGGSLNTEKTARDAQDLSKKVDSSAQINASGSHVEADQRQKSVGDNASRGENHTTGDGVAKSVNRGQNFNDSKSIGDSASERKSAGESESTRKQESGAETFGVEGSAGGKGTFSGASPGGAGGKAMGAGGAGGAGGEGGLIKSGGGINTGGGVTLGGNETTSQTVDQALSRDRTGSLDRSTGHNQSVGNTSGFGESASLKADNTYSHGRGQNGSDNISASSGNNFQIGGSVGSSFTSSASQSTQVAGSNMYLDSISKDDYRLMYGNPTNQAERFDSAYSARMQQESQIITQAQQHVEHSSTVVKESFKEVGNAFEKLSQQGGQGVGLGGLSFGGLMGGHSTNAGGFNSAFSSQDANIRSNYGSLDANTVKESDAFRGTIQQTGLVKPGELGSRGADGFMTSTAAEADNGKVYLAAGGGVAAGIVGNLLDMGTFSRGPVTAGGAGGAGTGGIGGGASGSGIKGAAGAALTFAAPVALAAGASYLALEAGEATGLLKQTNEAEGMKALNQGDLLEASRTLPAGTFISEMFKRGLESSNTAN